MNSNPSPARIAKVLITMLLLMPLSLLAETEPCSCSVESALNEFLIGASTNDSATHDRFWAEDLIYTSSSGLRFGKETIMAGFADSPAAAEPEVSPTYSATEINVSFEAGLALLTFQLVAETPGDAGRIERYFNSGVLKNSADEGAPPHWQAMLWQATKIPNSIPEAAPDDVQE